jgi:PAS domain S-box-containing protein
MADDLPRTAADPLAFLAGGGEMGERTRAFDWSKTPVGPLASWPQSLKTLVRTMLDSRYAMWLGWGREFTFFYNDAYARMTLGPKHPWALGKSAREVWSEIWSDIGPRAESVIRTGQATWDEGLLLFLERQGFPEETYHTFSYSPVPDDTGGVGGMLCVVTEDTERTIGERRLRTLRELAARTNDVAKSVEEACQTATGTLIGNPHDLPFVVLYLLSDDGRRARLVGQTGLEMNSPACPAEVDLEHSPWPFRQVADSGNAVEVDDIRERFGPLPGGAWPEPTLRAVVLPMAKPGQARPTGFVVAGVSPRLVFNDGYRGFLDLLAGHVATAVANARAYEEERRRAEKLAELDRAKTAFFSNVSHEFRTPLTLMLGPVEDALAGSDGPLPPSQRERLEVVHRNGLRLQRLVNNLLDFSRIEAGRVRAAYEPTNLAAFTADLASNFRSACETAGLRLTVDCPPLAEVVFVDRPMWEKIVLNLLSNAFKFTFEGEIAVSMRQAEHAAELRVRDTGTGIPAEEMPRLFERFHRVENARGRTHEGSGIGLALVQDLVKLHSGSITAESEAGRGTTFVISIPLGTKHLPREQVGSSGSAAQPTTAANPFVEEALRWLPDAEQRPDPGSELPSFQEDRSGPASSPHRLDADRPRVLVADDNADMRRYVLRLLSGPYAVEAVPDGAAALDSVRRQAPDLILSDVMMPRLDGFGLLRALRADPRTSSVPVVLLSARAGEESRVEGMKAGADDYLVKPFSARELLARVGALLQINRLRRESEQAIRQSEERFRVLFETMTEGFAIDEIIFDDAGRGCDLRYLEANPAFERHTGLKRADIVGRTTLEMFPDAEPVWFELFGEVAKTGAPAHFQGKFGPLERWFEVSAYRTGPNQVATVFFDITEQKRGEERERQLLVEAATANAQFRAFFEQGALFAGIMQVDGTLIEANRLLLEACGYTREQVVGKLFWEGPWWNRAPELMGRIQDASAQAAAGETFRAEMPYFLADGSERTVDFILLPIKDEAGRVMFLAPTGTDITDRKRAEEALQQSDRRKDEFLATLAHELRNPLAPIRNGLQIMRLGKGDPEASEQARTMMERQLGQMVHLVDDLLDLSRISRGKIELRKERVELAKVIQQAVETSRPLIEASGHDLTITVPPGPVYVDADVTRLAQVFSNLLNNAAKYTEQGGRVQLAVQRRGGEVVVSVKDNGVGIPAHMLPKVFEMFTQVDRNLERSQGGLGIGLSIVKRLVEMHGGSVGVESDGPGMGSEFVVRLPVVLAVAQPSGGDDEPTRPSSRRKVLVVDDNKDAAMSLAMMLKLMGNEAKTAHDGLEALDVAAMFRPDLILLDIGMPRLNGHETARRIREQPWSKGVLLVALTGWGQEEDRRRSDEAGFDSHMVKPVEPAALAKLLANLHADTA